MLSLSFLITQSGKKLAENFQTLYGPPMQALYGPPVYSPSSSEVLTRILSAIVLPISILSVLFIGILYIILRKLKTSDKKNTKNRKS